jgi:acyl-CoA thioesterase II
VLSSSFHAGGPSGDYEPPAPVGIPGPEHLPPTRFAKPGVLDTADASYDQPYAPQRRLWFLAGCELPDDLHAAGVAYATDHGPFGAARRIVDTAGAGLFDAMFRASLDHAIWFHRPPRIDDWVLYDVEAVTHRDDRILTSGRILDGDGRRVATVAQEILARAPTPG